MNNQDINKQQTGEDEIDLRAILFRFLYQWPWFVASIFLCLALAYTYTRIATPIYQVSASVIVADDKPGLGLDLFESSGLLGSKSNVENEIGILKSYALAVETIKSLGLDVFYHEEGFLKSKQLYANLPFIVEVDWNHAQVVSGNFEVRGLGGNKFVLSIDNDAPALFMPHDPMYKLSLEDGLSFSQEFEFDQWIESDNYRFRLKNIYLEKDEKYSFAIKDTHSLALKFIADLNVSVGNKMSSIINLSMNTPVRKMGQDYLNSLLQAYLNRELKEKNRVAENTVKFIDQQLTGITDSLSFFEGRLENYRAENRIFNLSEEGTVIFNRLQELEKQKAEAEITLRYYESLQTYLRQNQLEALVAPSIIGVTDPLLNALVMNLGELQAQKTSLSANYTEQTPIVREVNSKLASTKLQLQENVTSALANARSMVKEKQDQIRKIEANINSLPATERKLMGLERQFTINENIYVYLLQKRAESEIAKASNMPKNNILDQARADQNPVAPRKLIILLVGFLIGLLIPAILFSLIDYFNTKIETPLDLEGKIPVPLIGFIGHHTGDDALPVLTNPRSTLTESFRAIRSDITYLSGGKERLTILMTSTISGEGKTFSAINLAAAFSLVGKKVIILGLDLRKPRIAQDFGMSNDIGMSSILSSNMHWKEAIKHSGYDNLDIILSGPIPPNPAELLEREKFTEVMKEIKAEYDIVLMDCPPVGLVSETKNLFDFADISFYVFRQDYSEKQNIQVLNSLVEKNGVKSIYAILNDVGVKSGYGYGYRYGYGYGYGSNYGYHDNEKAKPWYKRLFGKA
ncbi:GumC family protein [Belliella kenyensis]|uniref:non-specific protein-tyrosine kinase n=1 Tax=Belliella kenyensis TaxID=1472724 RepID=A0ABV8EIQ7_9BACT|nr:polysaccharide biosynthesis tyrosine autokinase [Belliella kenyensis]MCH7401705.1 polysaccharide biosynthesis tyrosine autokinase [Belliella kenyensis]MDN3604205.1 polysaccharide biosynthesis tyrosine autokinase [Belliella kenyensis]